MRYVVILLLGLVIASASWSQQPKEAFSEIETDDGRIMVLYKDKTWDFKEGASSKAVEAPKVEAAKEESKPGTYAFWFSMLVGLGCIGMVVKGAISPSKNS